MKHICAQGIFGRNWSVTDKPKVIYCDKLYGKLKQKKYIQFKDICWASCENPERKKFGPGKMIKQRYKDADLSFPPIVADGVMNPCNRKYRMIDGSHRMAKMVLDFNQEAAEFFIISKDMFYSLLEDT
jgi:hypothetical protein